ncbi:6-phosphogluconolactonase [Bacteroides sp. OttesenSCG-928-D19]|nr:6-phosphogluconolactonase [Bacteroides sp. OttesenSCG-928-D19]
MNINIYPSATETACALIQYINKLLSEDVGKVYNIAFSGGLTPSIMYDLWANEFVETTPWKRIHFWWVDERCVRPENSDSNYGQMRNLLLNVAPIPQENIFRIKGEDDPRQEVARYTKMVKKFVPCHQNMPRFDLVLLGIGEDGHTSSIFPGHEHLLSTSNIYEETYNLHTGQKRIALTGQPIINSGRVVFLVTGKSKAAIVKEIFSSGDAYPASYIAHRARHTDFFLDEYAASQIE